MMNNLSFFRLVRIGSYQQCSSGKYTVWWLRCCNQSSISPAILASGKRGRYLSTQSLVVSQDNNDIPSKQQKQERKRKTQKEKKPDLRLPNRAFVSCLPGLERILSSELTALKIDHQSQVGGATLLKSPVSIVDIYRCHLFLGTATEIRLRCTEPFSARTFPELRRKVRTFISWKDLFAKKNANFINLLAKVTSNKSKLFHTSAIRERIIEEINNALRQNGDDDDDNDFINGATDLGTHSDDGALVVKLDVRVTKDMFDVGLCTSVVPLHRRGYRFETAKAPLREDIAYAMLWSSGWKPSYFIDGQDNKRDIFLDPFCGSGTIAIEAAAMANSLPPGRFLDPPLKGTMLYDEDKWLQTVQTGITASSKKKKKIGIPTVYASDRDKGAVKAAKRNAERAGVLDIMDIRHCPIASQPLWESFGRKPNAHRSNKPPSSSSRSSSLFVVTNPPFGNRISSDNTKNKEKSSSMLLPLYQTLSDRIRRCRPRCSSFAVLTNNPNLVARAGLKDCLEILRVSHGGRPAYVMQSTNENSTNT